MRKACLLALVCQGDNRGGERPPGRHRLEVADVDVDESAEGLGGLREPEHADFGLCPPVRSARNSRRRLWWNRSILPVVVGDRGAVWRWEMPFSLQIRSNNTSTGCGPK
jgi:hypothetical protein